jgi:hypothetical protein
MAFLKVVKILMIYKNTKYHVSMLTGANFASTSDVSMSAILEWLDIRN